MRGERSATRYQLGELAEVTGGLTLGRKVPEAASVELPYLRVANVQDGFIDTEDIKTIRVPTSEVGRFRVLPGDVLLTEGGDYDKLGRGAVWDGRIDPCLHQNHVFRIRCTTRILPDFLALYIASNEGRKYFLRIANQTTNLATINSSQLKAMPIPCPLIEDQARTVEVIKAISDKEYATEEAIRKFSTIEEAVTTDLMRPRSAWRSLSIGDLGTVITGSTPPVEWDSQDDCHTLPLITPSQVSSIDGITTPSRFIDARHYPNGNLRKVAKGSTLAVCIGFGSGKVALSDIDCLTNQQINSVTPFPDMDPRFVYLAINSAMRRARARTNLQVTPIINKSEFAKLPVEAPDELEQRGIADRIWVARESQMRMRADLTKLHLLKHGLTNDLLNEKYSPQC